MKENISNQKGNPMKVYAVVKGTSYTNNAETIFFTSKNKALGYIYGMMTNGPRGYEKEKQWYNSTWCYDEHKLFDSKNWDKYVYVTDGGSVNYRIKQVNVL